MINYNQQERYVNFYTDFAFKKLFGTEANKELLISFLNALFDGKETIKDITYLQTEHIGESEFDRRAVFDVYCESETGEKFLIEMQKANREYFKDRSIYYATFPIREQAKRGDWNYELKRVYAIAILNFTFSSHNDYLSVVKLCDTKRNEVFFDKLTFMYLEMPKFNKKESELNSLFEKWLYAIKNLNALYDKPISLQEKVFLRLFEQAEIASLNFTDRQGYEQSLKIYRDWYSVMQTQEKESFAKGKKEGLAEGIKKGKEEGREEGRVEGREEGRNEVRLKLAKSLKDMGMPYDSIANLTDLSVEDIEKL